MRLEAIKIDGFRGFSRATALDLGADVIILQGANGTGKTSLLDAVLWALTGSIERFGEMADPISIYSREGIARVELTVSDGWQSRMVVTRFTDGKRRTVRVHANGETYEASSGEARIQEFLMPGLRMRADPVAPLANVFTRGVYLQQDVVRQFIDTDTPLERFQLIGEIIGAGEVLALQSALEKSRNQWSRAITSKRRDELTPLHEQMERVEDQLRRLEADAVGGAAEVQQASARLYGAAVELIGLDRLSVSSPPTSSTSLDRLLREIAAVRANWERELATAISLLNETTAVESEAALDQTNLETLIQQNAQTGEVLNDLERDLEVAVKAEELRRQRLLEERSRTSRLATMAEFALAELGEVCPVCQQPHDAAHTREHLAKLIAAANESEDDRLTGDSSLEMLIVRRSQLVAEQASLQARIRSSEAVLHEAEKRRSVYLARMADFGIGEDDAESVLKVRIGALEERIARVGQLLREGEVVSLSIVRLSEQQRRLELRRELEALKLGTDALTQEVKKLENTHETAGRIIEGLRAASLEFTKRQIGIIEPTFQRIYSRIDPHPTFRLAHLETRLERGRGQLKTSIADPHFGEEWYEALHILSSSQLNSFAVSLFLALNLSLPSLRLNLVMLDDPLQSLDSINLLGLVDVLRRFRQHRQIVVSTHEDRLLGLLQRKLRPVASRERMLTLHFGDWTRDGPDVRSVETVFDEGQARVLAA